MLCLHSSLHRHMQGLHVDEISKKTGLDPQKIGKPGLVGYHRSAKPEHLSPDSPLPESFDDSSPLPGSEAGCVCQHAHFDSVGHDETKSRDNCGVRLSNLRYSLDIVLIAHLPARSTSTTILSALLLWPVISKCHTKINSGHL
jgi:hypothetical protein